jgi:hypothetical protein
VGVAITEQGTLELLGGYRTSPNEVTSRSMVDPFRRKDFACDVVVTPFDEVL